MFLAHFLLSLLSLFSILSFASEKVAPDSAWGAALVYSQEDADFIYGGHAMVGESHWHVMNHSAGRTLDESEVMVFFRVKVDMTTDGLWLNRLLEKAQKQAESSQVEKTSEAEGKVEYREEIVFAVPVQKSWISEPACEYGILTLVFDDNNEVSKFDGACIVVK